MANFNKMLLTILDVSSILILEQMFAYRWKGSGKNGAQ
jgi:hypothetical protein